MSTSHGSKCKYENCNTLANYGIIGTKTRMYCVSHKPSEYVYVAQDKCNIEQCQKLPSFGIKGTHKSIYCKNHAPTHYVYVSNPMCIYKDCNIHATFGLLGKYKAEYCYAHCPDGYIDVLNPKCIFDKCMTRPSFGQLGSHKAEYCLTHKPNNYVNVVGEKCIFIGCTTKPIFNEPGLSKPIWCKQHKSSNMIDVTHKKCTFDGCETRPNFGLMGTNDAISCAKHKLSNYVNVLSKLCRQEGCSKQPIFGDSKTRQKEFCATHKKEGYVDVANKMCEGKDCTTRASYGLLFSTHKHCATHRNKNEYLKNKPKCPENNCKEIPCYTDQKDNYPIRCEIHKTINDLNVVEQKCSSCGLMFYIKEGNKCNDCSLYNMGREKAKEDSIKLLLENNGFKFIHDKIPDGGCNSYRPDFILDFGLNVVIVECDENQHKSYACECEQKRMINLFQDFGGSHLTFIRYNPDNYIDNTFVKRNGSSTMNHKRLISAIKSFELHPPKEPLTVMYLCYDGDDGCNKLLTLDYENLTIYETAFKPPIMDNQFNILNDEYVVLSKFFENENILDNNQSEKIKPKLKLLVKPVQSKIQLKYKQINL